MNHQTLYKDDFIEIFALANEVFIQTFKPGLSPNQFNTILTSHPQIQITNFNCLNDALNIVSPSPQKFGQLKERIVVSVTPDELKAYITFNLSKEELELQNREKLIIETYEVLKRKNINFGIKKELFFGDLQSGKKYVIAEGTPAIDGEDCKIRMYELEEPRPEIREDGKANFYELKLINKVKAGDWLGERIDATEGFPGKTVYGNTIYPIRGKNYPLSYDRNTVYEVVQSKKVVLFSKIDGAVHYFGNKITVSNHLEIDGDVDFKTGNIIFDGYVTIRGTVTDGFYVEATKDIEISSPIGLGNIKGIKSREGSIYIKGGISSKGSTQITAQKNIYTKFVDNSRLSCGGIAHIGFYCINSIVEAKEVFIESIKGNIIGGRIKAEVKITVPILGSQLETRTVVALTGFDRKKLTKMLEDIVAKINKIKDEQKDLKLFMSKQDPTKEMTSEQSSQYNSNIQKLSELKGQLKSLEEERKNLSRYLTAKGEGEIAITKKVYSNCIIIIKNMQTEIKEACLATTFFAADEEIKRI
ncbi:DUF342 domain-containing protein [Acetivibrio mesophilus]|uniref:DUF342 domain-containing protein n=1 Tax=Acetivibrio mesophilus TaxID=2487273 RepID=A0A4Q0I1Q5_9FIRM|nr:FapA family protein [Acetivibrio mesophilus]RXE58076.1 DUF342 domain-containing protein [Acetivibrio mesophilus]